MVRELFRIFSIARDASFELSLLVRDQGVVEEVALFLGNWIAPPFVSEAFPSSSSLLLLFFSFSSSIAFSARGFGRRRRRRTRTLFFLPLAILKKRSALLLLLLLLFSRVAVMKFREVFFSGEFFSLGF